MDDTNSFGKVNIPMAPFFSDFDQELNFDQVLEMIRGVDPNPIDIGISTNFDPLTVTKSLHPSSEDVNKQFYGGVSTQDVFNSLSSQTMSSSNNSTTMNSLTSRMGDEIFKTGGEDDEDEDDDEDFNDEAEHSSATTISLSKNTCKKGKADRSRTLISERRRRGRMKDKLYALRALVPNITKMDKASIVGDAVLYVRDLQEQAKKLKSEIEDLEYSLKATEGHRSSNPPKKNAPINLVVPMCKIIMKMDVLQIEDREFYVKVVTNRAHGVAVSLYKALASLSCFLVHSSHLNIVCERFVLTFTLNVPQGTADINLANLNLWLSGAFLSQGFEIRAF